MSRLRAALALLLAVGAAVAIVSGGSSADPRTPMGSPGLPAPFLGTAVVGRGGLTAAVDAYGDVVDLRVPGPAGRGLIDNPSDRQAAGSVPAGTGIVPRVRLGGPRGSHPSSPRVALPLWKAGSLTQRYLPGTNVVRTTARFAPGRASADRPAAGARLSVVVTSAAVGQELAAIVRASGPAGARAEADFAVEAGLRRHCRERQRAGEAVLLCGATRVGAGAVGPGVRARVRALIRSAAADDRRWLARARPLGPAAPAWARRMYRRSLLTLRALTDRRTGAVAAGARDGWAFVWPRDAGTAALALAASGYRPEARRIARFLLGLELGAAARFAGDGTRVPGRSAQGDAAGWVTVAARAAGLAPGAARPAHRPEASTAAAASWRGRPDYQEGSPGDYLGNAIAATAAVSEPKGAYDPEGSDTPPRAGGSGAARSLEREFGAAGGLVRSAGDPGSGLDSAAAWAVRPFSLPALHPAAGRTMARLTAQRTRFGITPGAGWPGTDPWTAPTAWTAWSLAALAGEEGDRAAGRADRRRALLLLGDLRRAATPAGDLPERVDARDGIPRSTTPLAWSHALAILALRQLWPGPGDVSELSHRIWRLSSDTPGAPR